jgi:hypothetical protein
MIIMMLMTRMVMMVVVNDADLTLPSRQVGSAIAVALAELANPVAVDCFMIPA